MASEEVERAREQARKAREEAERLRREARELAHQARDHARLAAREARDSARIAAREARRAGRFVSGAPTLWNGNESVPGDETRTDEPLSLDGVLHVSVDQGAGKLTLRSCADGETVGVSSWARTAPRIEVRRDGDRLMISVPQGKGWLLRRRTGPTTIVRLAPGLESLKANLGYGELSVRDLSCGSARLDVGAGTLAAFALAANLHAAVGAGKLNLTAHQGLVNASTGTGDVQLDVARVVDGEYKVSVGMGRVEVRLPAGARVRLDTTSGIGKSVIAFPGAGDDAPSTLKATAGIGEVSVKERTPQEAQPPQGVAKPQRPGAAANRHEAEELRILQMLEQGKISSQDAADLIAALRGAGPLRDEPEE